MTGEQKPGGLEVVAYSDAKTLAEVASDTHPGGRFITISRHQQGTGSVGLVTAESAAARIAQIERALEKTASDFREAAEAHASEKARADRLAKALGEIAEMCPATCETSTAHDMAQIAAEALREPKSGGGE